ncbi:MAG: DUF5050 domain-containing protein [Chloroflexi bacterium]|nr:DUF5050 domain-containing protein [Chloroflexota bacterium]
MLLLIRIMLAVFGGFSILLAGFLENHSPEIAPSYHLAFISTRSGYLDYQLYRMRADGQIVQQLTYREPDNRTQRSPAWSPDGEWITFTSYGTQTEIYRVRPDGSDLQPFISPLQQRFFGSVSQPNWSPDGRKVAFIANDAGSPEIFVLAIDSNNIQQVTESIGTILEPRWSPDSQWIAFSSNRTGKTEIYKIRADGSDEKRLTDSPGWNRYPSWSPDGQWLTFASDRDGAMQIYRMRADGSGVQQLTSGAASTLPVWSPDGHLIAYVSEGSGKPEIYTMKPDGSQPRQITRSTGDNVYPVWAPPQREERPPIWVPALVGLLILPASLNWRATFSRS